MNIKGEVELGNDIDKSVFNEHLEEIIYFFQRTEYNVVIIEDLPTLWNERLTRIEGLSNIIEFSASEQAQIEGKRVYINSTDRN